jgi:uncharacterized membrane protein YgaE (UPF0421/DUF939 family)
MNLLKRIADGLLGSLCVAGAILSLVVIYLTGFRFWAPYTGVAFFAVMAYICFRDMGRRHRKSA